MAIQFLNTVQVDTSVLYVDTANDRVGIGTTSPSEKLEVIGKGIIRRTGSATAHSDTDLLVTDSTAAGSTAQIELLGGNNGSSNIKFADTDSYTVGSIDYNHSSNSMSFRTNSSQNVIINSAGNVGIGTTSPGEKLQVDGVIDANGSDGYKINGKAWAVEVSNNLQLGDWDGQEFSTSIYDNNSANIVTIKDYGTMIKCSSLSSTYGASASLAIGTAGATSSGAAVITLSNSDTTASAGDSTGTIQFAIKADTGTTLGYTSAIISGSISANAGTGNAGGGILDFKTSPTGMGSSPATRMRINQSGNVGIGTTSPSELLHISSLGPARLLIEADTDNVTETDNAQIILKQDGGAVVGNLGYKTNTNGIEITNQYAGADGILTFGTSNTERIRVTYTGDVGIGTTSPSEKLEVDGSVKADNYINQRVAWNVGFLANSVNTSSYYYIPVGYLSETTSNQYYNNWVASYAGRVRKIVMRNLGSGSTPTATTINFRITVNGTVTYTGGNATITGSGLNQIATHEFNPGSSGSPFFNATDRVQVAYRTNGLWQYAATSISLEYTE